MKLKQFNFKKVKSTNQTSIRLIKNSKNEFGLINSEIQSNGKGQYGRKWKSYKGNIFLSFFYRLDKINLSIASLTKKNCYLVRDVVSKYYKKGELYTFSVGLEGSEDLKYAKKVADFLGTKHLFFIQ